MCFSWSVFAFLVLPFSITLRFATPARFPPVSNLMCFQNRVLCLAACSTLVIWCSHHSYLHWFPSWISKSCVFLMTLPINSVFPVVCNFSLYFCRIFVRRLNLIDVLMLCLVLNVFVGVLSSFAVLICSYNLSNSFFSSTAVPPFMSMSSAVPSYVLNFSQSTLFMSFNGVHGTIIGFVEIYNINLNKSKYSPMYNNNKHIMFIVKWSDGPIPQEW